VKKGPWAPLRLSNMLSRPATGMTRMVVMAGVEEGRDSLGMLNMHLSIPGRGGRTR